MGGAFAFTVVVIGVLVIGTYLLQGAILLLQLAIWVVAGAARIAFYAAGALVFCVCWLFDRKGATAAVRRAEAAEALRQPLRPGRAPGASLRAPRVLGGAPRGGGAA